MERTWRRMQQQPLQIRSARPYMVNGEILESKISRISTQSPSSQTDNKKCDGAPCGARFVLPFSLEWSLPPHCIWQAW